VENIGAQKSRVLWVDFAKAFGIWLVIVGHMTIPSHLTQFIFAFHMPLFFFISGYLEKNNRSVKDEILHGVKTLLIPYVILYLLFFVYNISIVQHFGTEQYSGGYPLKDLVVKPLVGMFFGIGRSTHSSTMLNVPLWFLVGLFCTKIIHRILFVIVKGNIDYYILGIGVVIIGMFGLKFIKLSIPFSLLPAVEAFPFFAVGNILQEKNRLKTVLKNRLMSIIISIAGFVIIFIGVIYNGKADINYFIYGKDALLFYILGFVGIISTMCISLLYTKQNWLITTFSNGTIIILAFHGLLNGYIFRITSIFGLEQTLLLVFIVSVLNMFIEIIPIKFIQRFIPIIVGGRK
jgi:fucose 4-O-acetylase-like acetyltransferase